MQSKQNKTLGKNVFVTLVCLAHYQNECVSSLGCIVKQMEISIVIVYYFLNKDYQRKKRKKKSSSPLINKR